eukprot:CAMPEP_0201505100 /NCGR_PEP_ID=MMETSP0151_2-20130828/85579_1 /ASSEMBLY_ACC=CAM_ASM_000257 /TAXON_ID=200890 /ORGANISM="Paramoeba atlantica, Strain 621/1 / CCAP 1560/9" /LENGTH=331 /DNA_ID=CAMNT_0047898921 /DNA_START=33 /DNA_END=1028 /DNA_ORIENTATION=-
MARRLVCLFLFLIAIWSSESPPAPSTQEKFNVGPDYAADSHYAYYQPQYSFYPPFSIDRNVEVKNFDYGGSTMIFEDSIRLTPDAPDRRGFLWGQNPILLERWEAIFALKITGKGRIFGDGMGFWWTKSRMKSGPIFGNENMWEGLGILIDTYDNNYDGKHPYLSAFWNDGTKLWDHDNDGGEFATVGCKIKPNFRNKNAIQVVVSYFIDKIQVLIFDEKTEKWYDCLNMTLPYDIDPSLQYFGFTASTGSVSDAHDLLSFEVYDMKKMEEDGHNHQHVDPSQFSQFDDDSVLSLIMSVFFWILIFSGIAVLVYIASLYLRTKDKKRGHII